MENMKFSTYFNLTDFKNNYLEDYNLDDGDYYDYSGFLLCLQLWYEDWLENFTNTNEEIFSPDFKFDVLSGLIPNENLLNVYCDEMNINKSLSLADKLKIINEGNWYALYMFLILNFEEIIKFIERERRRFFVENTNNEPVENPENDFSDNSDKVKLIILEKLGVIDYIKTIQTKPEIISHTSEILSAITGIGSKTLNTYLYPMLRQYPDKTDPNSPYKNPENLLDAEKTIHKLKVKNTDANR